MILLRKYGVPLDGTTPGSLKVRLKLRQAGSDAFATDAHWTPVAGDVLVSKDFGVPANIAALPAYSNGWWEFTLSAAELTARSIAVAIDDAAVVPDWFVAETFGHASAMWLADYTDRVDVGKWLGTAVLLDGGKPSVNASNLGAGARTVTITVNDGAAALQNARVRLTEGANTYFGDTNAAGVVVLNVNDAAYTVAITKSGYSFAGTTLVVDGDEAATYSMTATVITPAADPAQTTGYLTTRHGHGTAEGSVTVYFRLVDPTGAVDAYERTNFTATSDVNGLLQVTLMRSSIYEGRLGVRGDWTRFTTGADPTYALPEILGAYGS